MKKATIIFGISLYLIGSLNAQEKFDIAGLSFNYNSKVGLLDPVVPELDNLDLNVTELDAFVMIPSKLKNEKTILLNGLQWHYVKTPFEDFPNNISFKANLHSIQYTFGINQKFSETWGVLIFLKPTLASNFKGGISSDDFFFQGSALAHKTVNEKTKYGIGIAYINGFGEPQTVPILMYDYKTESIHFNVLAPVNLNFEYSVGKIIYGFKVELEGGEFHLSNKDGGGPIVTNLSSIKFSRFNIGPTLGWSINKNSRLEVSAGIALKRTLKTIDNSGSEIDRDLKNGLYIKTGLYFGRE